MYVYLVVLHGAGLKNKCFNAWNSTVCPFSVGIEAFLGRNQGGGGILDLEFFEKKFCSKIHFYQMLIAFALGFFKNFDPF